MNASFHLATSPVDTAARTLDRAFDLRRCARAGMVGDVLRGLNIAVVASDPETPTAVAWFATATLLGGRVVRVRPDDLPVSRPPGGAGTASLLSRLYDAVIAVSPLPLPARDLVADARCTAVSASEGTVAQADVMASVMTALDVVGPFSPRARFDASALPPAAWGSVAEAAGLRVLSTVRAQADLAWEPPAADEAEALVWLRDAPPRSLAPRQADNRQWVMGALLLAELR